MKSTRFKVVWIEDGNWHTDVCTRNKGQYITEDGKILDATLIYGVEDYE